MNLSNPDKTPVARLRAAYLNLRLRRPATRVLVFAVIVSVFGAIAAVLAHSALVWIPVGVLIAVALVMHSASDDDESDGA